MLAVLKRFWDFVGFAGSLLGIIYIPADLYGLTDAYPWLGRVAAMVDRFTLLAIFATVLVLYIFWIDLRPWLSRFRNREAMRLRKDRNEQMLRLTFSDRKALADRFEAFDTRFIVAASYHDFFRELDELSAKADVLCSSADGDVRRHKIAAHRLFALTHMILDGEEAEIVLAGDMARLNSLLLPLYARLVRARLFFDEEAAENVELAIAAYRSSYPDATVSHRIQIEERDGAVKTSIRFGKLALLPKSGGKWVRDGKVLSDQSSLITSVPIA